MIIWRMVERMVEPMVYHEWRISSTRERIARSGYIGRYLPRIEGQVVAEAAIREERRSRGEERLETRRGAARGYARLDAAHRTFVKNRVITLI